MNAPAPASPITWVIDVRRLPKKGMPVTIRPDAEALKALAAEHGLVSVEGFSAELVARDWKGDGVAVEGRVRARIVQSCVVTLAPVVATIDEPFEALFVPERSRLSRPTQEGEILLDFEGPDAPETFDGKSIDVGALAEEFFGLAIDPYPRAPGADAAAPEAKDDRGDSPFAALARLSKKS